MEKSIHELKAEFICVFEGEKINNFEIIANIFKTYKKCKSSIQIGF